MANPFNTIFRPLVRGFGEAASRAKPFYSGVDQAISAITQNKGTGQQMLAEILKTKGAAKELKDRPAIKAALEKSKTQKMTKQDVEKLAIDNPAPQFTEKTRGESAFEAEVDKRVAEMKRFRVNEIMDEMNPDSLPQSAEQWKAARLSAESVVKDEEKQIRQNVVDVLDDEGNFDTKFERWTIPGGTNHREILFQLPDNRAAPNAKYDDIAAKARAQSRLMTTEERAERSRLYDEIKRPLNFEDPHYSEPNILAHARVSDRFEPNGDKALHVEEVQSAWHQKARDTRKKEIKRLIDSGVSKAEANKQVPVEYGYGPRMEKTVEAYYETKSGQRIPVGFGKTKEEAEASIDVGWKNLVDIKYETFDKKVGEGVPDSPFKENWHELVMKRLLDDAVKNGYKKVYITPGAEQAKRYNLAKYISKIEYEPTEQAGRYEIVAYGKKGEVVYHEDMVNLRRIEELVGKDMARKIENDEGTLSSPNSGYRDWREFSGLELKSGGEGMLGFYDKMVPSFVNDYGAPYNMKMNLHDTPVGGNKYTVFEDSNPSPFSVVREGGSAIASRHGTREEAEAAASELSTQPLHSITITPEFEKHVQEKGQRLYQAIPAGIGAGIGAEALTEEEPAPMKKGGPVSLDAMRLAVMNKKVQHKQYGGPTFVRSGISRIRKNMNPVRGNTIIKEGGGNWLAGDVKRDLTPLLSPQVVGETPAQRIPKHEALLKDKSLNKDQIDRVRYQLEVTKRDAALDSLIERQLAKYVTNQMGTMEDPIRLAADAWPKQKATLLAAKQIQIDKATADMEKARQSRGFTPEMMTRSQARIRELEKERELIEFREGMHFTPGAGRWLSLPQLKEKRMEEGMPAEGVGQTENAKNWEKYVDANINISKARDVAGHRRLLEQNPWLHKVDPESRVYTAGGFDRGIGFEHMIDEMRNAVNPESGLPKELLIDAKNLSKWTVPQVTEHVDKINAWRAAQKAEADVARANNAATVLHKDYPEKGMKWVELKMPDKAPEGWVDDVTKGGKADLDPNYAYGQKTLADALKYEGEQLQHCVGGYCRDVIDKKSQIFSLRDAKGNPYATVEVKPGKTWSEKSGVFYDNPELESSWKKFSEDVNLVSAEKGLQRPSNYILQYPEWLKTNDPEMFAKYANVFDASPPSIAQIKGKGNRAPSEEYLPYVQDFVKSGKWSDVKDLHHTGLVRKSDYIDEFTSDQLDSTGAGEYITTKEIDAYRNKLNEDFINKFAKHRIKPDPESQDTLGRTDFMTVKELAELSFPDSLKRQADMIRGALQGTTEPGAFSGSIYLPNDGMKRGGVVNMQSGGIRPLAKALMPKNVVPRAVPSTAAMIAEMTAKNVHPILDRLQNTVSPKIAYAASTSKETGQPLVQHLTDKERDKIAGASLILRRSQLGDIFGSKGRLLNVHESGKTTANAGAKDSIAIRSEWEPQFLGGTDINYGYLTSNPLSTTRLPIEIRTHKKKGNEYLSPSDDVIHYGQYGLELGPEARSRSTFTLGDSLDGGRGNYATADSIINPHGPSLDIAQPGSILHSLAKKYWDTYSPITEKMRSNKGYIDHYAAAEQMKELGFAGNFNEYLVQEGLGQVGARFPRLSPRPINDPKSTPLMNTERFRLGALDRQLDRSKPSMGADYIEGQVHGGVQPQDVVRLYDFNFEPSLAVEKRAKKFGIEYVPMPSDTIYSLVQKEQPRTKRELAELLGVEMFPEAKYYLPSDRAQSPWAEQIANEPAPKFGKSFKGGGAVSDDAMRLAVMNKQLRKHHG